MTFTGILEDIEDIINWTKQQDFADPEKVILSGQSMGGYAAATAAPRVNPYALILMCLMISSSSSAVTSFTKCCIS